MRTRLRGWLRPFVRSERGVAAVEFALVVPIMLVIYMGTIEGSALIAMDRKVQSVAGAVGDLVARADKTISESRIRDYFRAASGIMTPYDASGVEQIVTAVDVSSTGVTTVVWSRSYKNGNYSAVTSRVVGTPYPLPAEMIAISKGKMVIAGEASQPFRPLLGIVFNQTVDLYRSSFFLPRFEGTITVVP